MLRRLAIDFEDLRSLELSNGVYVTAVKIAEGEPYRNSYVDERCIKFFTAVREIKTQCSQVCIHMTDVLFLSR